MDVLLGLLRARAGSYGIECAHGDVCGCGGHGAEGGAQGGGGGAGEEAGGGGHVLVGGRRALLVSRATAVVFCQGCGVLCDTGDGVVLRAT